MTPLLGIRDHAQDFLLTYLKTTESLFRSSLREIDPCADCRILPAADLSIPHDVIRIAGGFATGCLTEWKCRIPIIPIDTTVNIDTTSIFLLDANVSNKFTIEAFRKIRSDIEDRSSYVWNFHKGNHFIAACIRRSDNSPALIIHSNEKEFKYQYNGLSPGDQNWFAADVRVFHEGNRYLRLLIGKKASLFARMARMCEEYNIVRHAFIAEQLLERTAKIEGEYHKHHYYMPTASSVAMGCYLCDEFEVVPILSAPGKSIQMFEPHLGGKNLHEIHRLGPRLLVPHGWGKTSVDPIDLRCDKDVLHINGLSFPNKPTSSLGKHPGLVTRDFALDRADGSFIEAMENTCPGRVIDAFDQLAWYNRDGVTAAGSLA